MSSIINAIIEHISRTHAVTQQIDGTDIFQVDKIWFDLNDTKLQIETHYGPGEFYRHDLDLNDPDFFQQLDETITKFKGFDTEHERPDASKMSTYPTNNQIWLETLADVAIQLR